MALKDKVRFANILEKSGSFFADLAFYDLIYIIFLIIEYNVLGKDFSIFLHAILTVTIFIAYTSYLLVKKGATYGQKAFELKAVSSSAKKLTIVQAILRQTFFSAIAFMVFYFLFNAYKCRLFFTGDLFYATFFTLIFLPILSKNGQSIYELLTKSYEIGKIDFSYANILGKLTIAIVIFLFLVYMSAIVMFVMAKL